MLHTSQHNLVGGLNSVDEFGWRQIGWGEIRLHGNFGWGISVGRESVGDEIRLAT